MVQEQQAAVPDEQNKVNESHLYTYQASDLVYASSWSVRKDKPFRLALCSFREEASNYVQLLNLDEEQDALVCIPNSTFRHDYPPTKVMFMPDKDTSKPDLLATTGEHLRLWSIHEDGVELERLMTNSKTTQYCAALTSFDWSDLDPRWLAVSSIDTTCTVWDIERGEIDTQLIAHDKEVYDLCWGGSSVFGTVSGDGSVRIFDLRDKEHSTIIYESPDATALCKLSWNKQDPRYLAALMLDSPKTIILDIRCPGIPCAELATVNTSGTLAGHTGPVNGVAWAPHSAAHLCTASDDAQVLIWEVNKGNGRDSTSPSYGGMHLEPILAYRAGAEIQQLQWSASQPEWVAICFDKTLQALRV